MSVVKKHTLIRTAPLGKPSRGNKSISKSDVKEQKLDLYYRPGTTDERAIKEVIQNNAYRKKSVGFTVNPGETWLDLGANIGSFAAYCWLHNASAHCYEPDPDCFALLHRSFSHLPEFKLTQKAVTCFHDKQLPFCKGTKENDHYRATIARTRTPHPKGMLPNICISSLPKKKWDGIKMDIESAEFGIIDNHMIPPCHKLVLEYHFSKDKCLQRFRKRIKILRTHFKEVTYASGLDRDYPNDKWPGMFDRLIFCQGWKS